MKNKRKPTPAAIQRPGWAYRWRIFDPSDPLQYTRHRQMFRNYLSRLPSQPSADIKSLLNETIASMKS